MTDRHYCLWVNFVCGAHLKCGKLQVLFYYFICALYILLIVNIFSLGITCFTTIRILFNWIFSLEKFYCLLCGHCLIIICRNKKYFMAFLFKIGVNYKIIFHYYHCNNNSQLKYVEIGLEIPKIQLVVTILVWWLLQSPLDRHTYFLNKGSHTRSVWWAFGLPGCGVVLVLSPGRECFKWIVFFIIIINFSFNINKM